MTAPPDFKAATNLICCFNKLNSDSGCNGTLHVGHLSQIHQEASNHNYIDWLPRLKPTHSHSIPPLALVQIASPPRNSKRTTMSYNVETNTHPSRKEYTKLPLLLLPKSPSLDKLPTRSRTSCTSQMANSTHKKPALDTNNMSVQHHLAPFSVFKKLPRYNLSNPDGPLLPLDHQHRPREPTGENHPLLATALPCELP